MALLPATTLFLGLLWAAIIPMWEIPDEPAHFAYVQDLGERPSLSATGFFSQEMSASYRLAGLDKVRFTGHATQLFTPGSTMGPTEEDIVSLPSKLRDRISPGAMNSARVYPPGYYLLASLPYRLLSSQDIITIMFGLRAFSALLTSVTVLFHYITLRQYFHDMVTARAATLLIILSPMYIFMGMAVNVDVLVWLLFSIFLYLATLVLQRGLSSKTNLLLGLVVAAGLLVKQTFLIGVASYLLLLSFLIIRRRITWPSVIRFALIFIGIIVAVDGWFYLSGAIRTSIGDQSTVAPAVTPLGFLTHFFEYGSGYRWALQETFWGSFGWLDTPLSSLLYGAVGAASLAGLVGFLAYLTWAMLRRRLDSVTVFHVLVVIVLGGGLSLVNYVVISRGEGWFFQGRYLFPVIAPIMALLVTGLTWFAGELPKRIVLALATVGMLSFHAAALIGHVIPRFYL